MALNLLRASVLSVLLITQPVVALPYRALEIGPTIAPVRQLVFQLRNAVGGATNGLAISGNRVYTTLGVAFTILDISNLVQPSRLGYMLLPKSALDIALIGNYAYVLCGVQGSGGESLMQIIDISDASKPLLIKSMPMLDANRIATSGKYAHVVSSFGLYVFDVSVPSAPQKIGQLDFPIASGPRVFPKGATVADGKLYIAGFIGRVGGILIVDISSPSRPRVLGQYLKWSYEDVTILDKYAYLASDTGLDVVDVSNPSNAFEVGHWYIGSVVSSPGIRIGIQGQYAYMINQGIFFVFDITNPASPDLIKRLDAGYDDGSGNTTGFVLSDNRAFTTQTAAGLRTFDITDPPNSAQIAVTPLSEQIRTAPWLHYGDYLYTGFQSGTSFGAQIIDLQDPLNPKVTATVPDMPNVIQGNYGYGSAFSTAFHIFSMTNPVSPTIVGSVPLTSPRSIFVVTGTYAYISQPPSNCGRGGCMTPGLFQVVNISNPSQPMRASASSNVIYPLAVKGGYLYAQGTNGFRILSLANPISPTEVSTYVDPLSNFYDARMQVIGDYGYLYSFGAGLRILDMHNPVQPVPLGALQIPVWQVVNKGQTAYILGSAHPYQYQVHVVDISDPRAPRIVASHTVPFEYSYSSLAVSSDGKILIGGTNFFAYELVEVELTARSILPNVGTDQ